MEVADRQRERPDRPTPMLPGGPRLHTLFEPGDSSSIGKDRVTVQRAPGEHDELGGGLFGLPFQNVHGGSSVEVTSSLPK